MPRCTSDATARCPWLGSASAIERWLSTRWLHASRRADSEAMKSRKSTGRRRDHIPPGLRKSGIPDSVLIPAPVNTTARRAFSTSARRRSRSGSPAMGAVNARPRRRDRLHAKLRSGCRPDGVLFASTSAPDQSRRRAPVSGRCDSRPSYRRSPPRWPTRSRTMRLGPFASKPRARTPSSRIRRSAGRDGSSRSRQIRGDAAESTIDNIGPKW